MPTIPISKPNKFTQTASIAALILVCAVLCISCGSDSPTGVSRSDLEGIWTGEFAGITLMGRTLSGSVDWIFNATDFELRFFDPPEDQAERISGDWKFADGKLVLTLKSSFPSAATLAPPTPSSSPSSETTCRWRPRAAAAFSSASQPAPRYREMLPTETSSPSGPTVRQPNRPDTTSFPDLKGPLDSIVAFPGIFGCPPSTILPFSGISRYTLRGRVCRLLA